MTLPESLEGKLSVIYYALSLYYGATIRDASENDSQFNTLDAQNIINEFNQMYDYIKENLK